MSTASTIQMTARQFLQLGEDPVGVRLELVDGEIAVRPSPTPNHSFAILQLAASLVQHIEAHDLGQLFQDVDTIFGEHDVRRPDLLFFSKSRLHLVGDQAMEGPPDLAVEVVSPSSCTIDRRDKFRQFEAGGVAHYWIVDLAQRTLEAFDLRDGVYHAAGQGRDADVLHLAPFPELSICLGRLWRPRT